MTDSSPLPAHSHGPVLLRVDDDGVAHVQLNRPESANGMDLDLLRALREALLQVHGRRDVRAVLLGGEGRNFCAGGDVHTFTAKAEALPEYIRVVTAELQAAVALMLRLHVPVVTAVQGYAAGGGGMGLVCASDFVVAGASSRFLAGATRVAMVPDAGVSVTLTQLVGLRKAMEILMLNPVIEADEALRIGLVTRVVPDDELQRHALELARSLARGAPAALAHTKRLLWSGIGRGVEAAMPEENQTQVVLAATDDAMEGLAAVIERREPCFTGR